MALHRLPSDYLEEAAAVQRDQTIPTSMAVVVVAAKWFPLL